MNILVYDVAAENGGAVTVLNWFYRLHQQDKNNQYVYLLGKYELPSTDNIRVINVPEIKKSWVRRMQFDYFGVRKYLQEYAIDRILSLQNTEIPFAGVYQTVYVHNALPFSEYRFGFFEDRRMWVYQNLIGFMIKKSIRHADEVIVQTNWMKRAVENYVSPQKGKSIQVLFPEMTLFEGVQHRLEAPCTFFYPANSAKFKNHAVILQAVRCLKKKGIHSFRCVFTLEGNENGLIQQLYEAGKKEKLNFLWIGQQTREEMAAWYARSVLLFPSYIETVGLPICEARSVGSPLILADCQYAREVVGSYEKTVFFPPTDAQTLAELMEQKIVEVLQMTESANSL